jgi:hypothetical protein
MPSCRRRQLDLLLLLYGGLFALGLPKERRGALCVLIAQPLPDLRHLKERA